MTVEAPAAHHSRPTTRDRLAATRRQGHPRLVLAVLAVVVAVDQATKCWGWRNVPGAVINPGGNQLVGPEVGTWYSAQLSGAVLDLQSAVVLALAVSLLVRVRRRVVAVPAALAVAGWCSNALDRLGLHFWTAPGSARGAVDFIPLLHGIYNVADFVILAGTALVLVAGAHVLLASRGHLRLRARPAFRRPGRGPLGTLGVVAAAGGLVAAVAFGAVHDGGRTSPEADGPGPGVTAGP